MHETKSEECVLVYMCVFDEQGCIEQRLLGNYFSQVIFSSVVNICFSFAGKLNEGELREYIQSQYLEVEVHDRDMKEEEKPA